MATSFYIQIDNTEKSEAYILRLHIGEGIYAGDANVKNCKDKACIKSANTNEIPVTIRIPTNTLGDFEETDAQEITRQSRNFKNLSDANLSNKINLEKMFLKINQGNNIEEKVTSKSKYFNSIFTQDDKNDFTESSQDPILNVII